MRLHVRSHSDITTEAARLIRVSGKSLHCIQEREKTGEQVFNMDMCWHRGLKSNTRAVLDWCSETFDVDAD